MLTDRAGGKAGTVSDGVVVNIQILRAAAALAVVLYHAQHQAGLYLNGAHLGFWGMSGVDLFFVISGFIMVHVTGSRRRSIAAFWTDRVIRIAPLYWLATLLIIVLFLAGFSPIGVAAMSIQDVVTSLLFVPDVRSDGHPYPVLDVGWTLIYEMYFYLLFGLTFVLRSREQAIQLLVVWFLAGWLVLATGVPLPFFISFLLQPITLLFAAGAGLGLLYRAWTPPPGRRVAWAGYAMCLSGAAWILVADRIMGSRMNDELDLRLLGFGVGAILIVTGALVLERVGRTLRSSTLLLLGAASYAIYLFHPSLVQLIAKALGAVFGAQPALAPVALVAGVLISGGVGVFIHLWIEKPLQAVLKRWTRSHFEKDRTTPQPLVVGQLS